MLGLGSRPPGESVWCVSCKTIAYAFHLVGLVLFAVSGSVGAAFAAGKAPKPAEIFEPALAKIRGKTQVPILLPASLPRAIPVSKLKNVDGSASDDGYVVQLFYTATDSHPKLSVGATTDWVKGDWNTRPVGLANGIVARFRPVSCGASCAPANLWWEQNGVEYFIQVGLESSLDEKKQESITMEVANSLVRVE